MTGMGDRPLAGTRAAGEAGGQEGAGGRRQAALPLTDRQREWQAAFSTDTFIGRHNLCT